MSKNRKYSYEEMKKLENTIINNIRILKYKGHYINPNSNNDKRKRHWFKIQCMICNRIPEIEVSYDHLKQEKRNLSCGCLSPQKPYLKSHHLDKQIFYNKWIAMNNRCHNPFDNNFINYGAKGIFVSNEFRRIDNKDILTQNDLNLHASRYFNFEKYLLELLKMQNYSLDDIKKYNLSIDRIDFLKGYERENLRWATPKEQSKNQSSSYFKYKEKYIHYSLLEEFLNIKHYALLERANKLDKNLEDFLINDYKRFNEMEFDRYLSNYKNKSKLEPLLIKNEISHYLIFNFIIKKIRKHWKSIYNVLILLIQGKKYEYIYHKDEKVTLKNKIHISSLNSKEYFISKPIYKK